MLPDLLTNLLDEAAHGPIALELADGEKEVLQNVFPLGRVCNFGMELQSEKLLFRMLNRSVGTVLGGCCRPESDGQFRDFVAV